MLVEECTVDYSSIYQHCLWCNQQQSFDHLMVNEKENSISPQILVYLLSLQPLNILDSKILLVFDNTPSFAEFTHNLCEQ